jgi:predicted HTH transcriptional regulator
VNSLKQLQPTLGDKQKTIYTLIKKKGPMTNRQIARNLGWDINRVTGRVSELVGLGKVSSKGTTFDKDTNRTVTLWS